MTKQKQKNWINRILILIMCSLVLVITAPQIADYTANSLIAQHATSMEKAESIRNAHTAYAAPTPEQKAKTKERIDAILEIQAFLSQAIWPVLYMIGGLMDNNLLFGGGMGQQLQDIWIPIRNIVNIFFVIALVGIALYNITGLGEDGGNYAIKAALPQLIIGIIAVNFSFLGIKVALDVVNVVSTAIFALPAQLDKDTIALDEKAVKEFCIGLTGMKKEEVKDATPKNTLNDAARLEYSKRIAAQYGVEIKPADSTVAKIQDKVADVPEKEKAAFTNALKDYNADNNPTGYNPICDGTILADAGNKYFGKLKSSNVAAAMAINFMKIPFISNLNTSSLDNLDDISRIAINVIFGLVMFLLFTASFLALLVVLLARVVVMWVSIALSPIILVTLAVPAVKEQVKGISKISEAFTKHLFVPIPIAFALSIGWIMLNVIGTTNLGSMLASGTDVSMGIPVVGLTTLQDLIVAIGCVAIIWMGVFEAAEGTMADFAVNWMKTQLQAAGQFIGTLPLKHLPIIPIGTKGNKYTVGAVAHGIENALRRANLPDDRLAKDMPDWFGSGGISDTKDLRSKETVSDAVGALRNNTLKPKLTSGGAGGKELAAELKFSNLNEKLRTELDKPENRELKKAIEAFHQAGEKGDDTALKAAGKALEKLLDSGPYAKMKEGTPSASADSTPSPATKPGTAAKAKTKDETTTPPPTTTPPQATDLSKDPTFHKVKVNEKDYYMSEEEGNDNLFNEDGSFADKQEALKTQHPAAFTKAKADRDTAKAARKKAHNEGVSHLKDKGKEHFKSQVALSRVNEPTADITAGGKIYITEAGVMTLVVGEGDAAKAFDIDPETATMQEITDADKAKARKAKPGTEAGTRDSAGGVDITKTDAKGRVKAALEQFAKAKDHPEDVK